MKTTATDKLQIEIAGEEFLLLADKAIHWPKEDALIVSDLHFGKGGHFRRAGIPIPRGAFINDLNRLKILLETFNVSKVLFLGDLFHSLNNSECEEAGLFFKALDGISFELIPGNHDVLSLEKYGQLGLTVLGEDHRIRNFRFVHEPVDPVKGFFLFCGHIHPGLVIAGNRIPCFWWSQTQMVLPSFGSFTGSVRVKYAPGDRLYGVLENSILEL